MLNEKINKCFSVWTIDNAQHRAKSQFPNTNRPKKLSSSSINKKDINLNNLKPFVRSKSIRKSAFKKQIQCVYVCVCCVYYAMYNKKGFT